MSKCQFLRRMLRPAALALVLVIVLLATPPSSGQIKGQGKGKQPDFIPAGFNDYKDMQDRLGIKKMRKGWSSKESDAAPEEKANPYKDSIPDLMTFNDGTKVTNPNQWPKRRAELVELFEREVYG